MATCLGADCCPCLEFGENQEAFHAVKVLGSIAEPLCVDDVLDGCCTLAVADRDRNSVTHHTSAVQCDVHHQGSCWSVQDGHGSAGDDTHEGLAEEVGRFLLAQ